MSLVSVQIGSDLGTAVWTDRSRSSGALTPLLGIGQKINIIQNQAEKEGSITPSSHDP